MGVPKFFRYISERYPCLSEFVKEYQIPVFDNLYLDMNGIIHMCSHPDDNNPHFRITEEKIFADIFHYIEVLFRMIKPQKVFFMAVDGVAPRAKMNQQRGRRFRSAKDAEKLEKEAVRKGETLPDVERFDSNCITPGTEFMARLHEQLKYFVVHKISTDKMWKRCRVILSGHETPGEGEHKIMDYIRYIRSQPGYDPNTRHCLYGLDADLIMLGLCTHDPHFSLLREEVKFGKKTKRTSVPEEIRFYLLHLSLMREYLELEFGPLKEMLKNVDKVEFDIEKIIDDWILMGFLVGNDFIPNLPNLHIANGALPVLYQAYIEVLPTLDGYINEAGTLNLERFEKFMKKLADIDFKNFEETQEDLLYMEAKSGRKQTIHTPVHSKIKDDEVDIEVNSRPRDPDLARLIQGTDELDISSEEESDKLSSSNEDEAFKNFKDEYYMNKLEYRKVTREVMREQAEGYVRAIQWNLNYYYNGVCSWSWFYPHHYSPYISDIKGFSNLKIEFELGKPFKPYEQLLAVLPTASKNLLPKSYHHLMTDENSVIKAYYPEEFQTDLNGKRQEWEAVVLVPFIDENILLEAMKPCNENLTLDEIKRNQHGPMLVYEYTDGDLGIYEAPKYFPNIRNRAKCTPVIMEDIRVSKEKLIKGAYPGAVFDVFYPGFPTMKHLKYTSELKKTKVKVFETPSRNENMILKILPGEEYFGDSLPVDLLGDTIWVGWPHLVEAKVIGVSNRRQKYVYSENDSRGFKVEEKVLFDSELEGVTQHYRDRLGIELGNTDILVHVQLMIGRRYVFTSGRRVNLEKQFSKIPSTYPLQSIVSNIKVHDEYQSTFSDIDDVFPTGSVCFSLTHPHYGSQGIIMDSKETLKNNHLKVSLLVVEEPDFKPVMEIHDRLKNSYMSLTNAASQLALSNYVFSRITGSLFVSTRNSEGSFKSVNIGLDLKFNKKNQETPGYTKKIDNVWLYTYKAVNLVKMYVEKFPDVFAYLSTSGDDEIMAEALFPDESEEKVKSIQVWLKTLPTHNIDRRVCGSSVLEQEIVEELEKIVDKIQDSPKDLVMQIKPQLLYKPEIQAGNLAPDPLVQTRVFDRIVNVREGFTVPLGLKGTVVAIHKSSNSPNEDEMYDVVFDKTFAGGMSLNCSDHRGYRLPKSSFINLTYGKRHMEQKTGVPGALRALAKERRTAHTFNNSDNTPINLRKQNSAFASFNNLVPFPQMKPPQYKNFQNQPRPHQQVNPTHDQANIKNSFYYMTDFTQTYDPKINKENSFNKRYLPMSVHNPPQMPQGPPKISKENSVNRRNLNTQEGIQGPSSSNPKENPRNIVLNVHNPPQSVRGSLNLNSGPVNLKPKTEVNTDFLRKILNIQANSNNTKSNGPQQASTTTWNQSRTQTNKEPNPSCATAKLLSHYQSSLLGCPRYTYLEEQGGFRAQVALPNGKVICGRIAKTREEASENVARDALNVLQNPNLLKEGLPSQFPVPPTKWVQERQPQNKMNSQIYVNKSHQMKQHQKVGGYFTNKADPEVNFTRSFDNLQHNSRVNSNSNTPNFVPLQALKKRQTHRTASNVNRSFSDSSQCTKSQTSDNSKSTKQLTDFSKLNSTESRENAEKTARQRKTRIAANFKQ